MAFHTKVLQVDPLLIDYSNDASVAGPNISQDTETYKNLQIAVTQLKTSNSPVAFPTETVYGLGASSLNSEACKNIYKAKNRPADNPLILHISALDQLKRILHADLLPIYLPLVNKFWPGPLTIILPVPQPQNNVISEICTHGQSTFAVRMPAHPVARALIAMADLPLAAPSANASTRPSPTRAAHVYLDLKDKIPLILDGGSCQVGLESTVIDGTVTPPRLLRPGGISLEQIKEAGGDLWKDIQVGPANIKESTQKVVPRTPGMKYKHYSPTCPVYLYLNTKDGISAIEQTVAHGSLTRVAVLSTREFDSDGISRLLSLKLNVKQVLTKSLGKTGPSISHNLFDLLREMDEVQHCDLILVEGVDNKNEGLAIMNRLCKAASKIYIIKDGELIEEK